MKRIFTPLEGRRYLPVASASERSSRPLREEDICPSLRLRKDLGLARDQGNPLWSISDGNNSRGPSGLGDEVGLCTSTWCCLVIPCYSITGSQRRDAFYRSTGLWAVGCQCLDGTVSMLGSCLGGRLLPSGFCAFQSMAIQW